MGAAAWLLELSGVAGWAGGVVFQVGRCCVWWVGGGMGV